MYVNGVEIYKLYKWGKMGTWRELNKWKCMYNMHLWVDGGSNDADMGEAVGECLDS